MHIYYKDFRNLTVNRVRFFLGAVLAVLSVLICTLWFDYRVGIAIASLFLTAGMLKINCEKPVTSFIILACWGIFCIFLSAVAPVWMVCPDNWRAFFDIGKLRMLLNLMVVAAIYGIFLALTGRIKPAVLVSSILLMVFASTNGFVYQFRQIELKPTDFLSVGTAMNVVSQYRFTVNPAMAYCWMLFAWSIFAVFTLPDEKPILPTLWYRLIAALASVVCLVIVWSSADSFPLKTWENQGSTTNGYYLNFCVNLRKCVVEMPAQYTDDVLTELEQRYTNGASTVVAEDLPTIIVIMNESFADLQVLGENINTNIPVTPILNSIGGNAVKGYALCSVFGGNTPNSEFEFLTGNSMAWLPDGSVAYQQYINDDSFSLPRLLESYGYETMATHPFLSNGWQRTKIYPLLGFDTYSFIEDYPQDDLLRTYVSDREMYEYVLDLLDSKGSSPLFLYGITMQNHGDYPAPASGLNYTQHIILKGYSQDYDNAEVYLSVLHEADTALGFLISELEKRSENVVLLFFGDHFPNIESDFYEEIHSGEFDTLSEQVLKYKVPFFIWSNRTEIAQETVECTSLSYLSCYLLEAAGITLPPYYRFLKDVEENIPSINAMGYYSKARQCYIPIYEAAGEEEYWLELYEISQYNNLFDKDNLIPSFFGQYVSTD